MVACLEWVASNHRTASEVGLAEDMCFVEGVDYCMVRPFSRGTLGLTVPLLMWAVVGERLYLLVAMLPLGRR